MEHQRPRTTTSNTEGEIIETEGENSNTREEVVESNNEKNKKEEELKEKQEIRGAIMVLAILGATVAYQAILNPPGGFWQDDLQSSNSTKGHTAGKPVMATKNPRLYGTFLAFNLAAFLISFRVMMIAFGPLVKHEPWRHRYLKWMNSFYLEPIEVNDVFLEQYMASVYIFLAVALCLWIFQHLKGPGLDAFSISIISLLVLFTCTTLRTSRRADTTSNLRNVNSL